MEISGLWLFITVCELRVGNERQTLNIWLAYIVSALCCLVPIAQLYTEYMFSYGLEVSYSTKFY